MELRKIKKSLFGFNKDGVIEYIAELNRRCAEKVEEVTRDKAEAVAVLARKNEELNAKAARLESELGELKEVLCQKDAHIEDLRRENNALRERAERHRAAERETAEILNQARAYVQSAKEKAEREQKTDVQAEKDKVRQGESVGAADAKKSTEKAQAPQDGVGRLGAIKGMVGTALKYARGGRDTAEARPSARNSQQNAESERKDEAKHD